MVSSLNELIAKKKKTTKEIALYSKNLKKAKSTKEKRMLSSHLNLLKDALERTSEEIVDMSKKRGSMKPLNPSAQKVKRKDPEQIQVSSDVKEKREKLGIFARRKELKDFKLKDMEKLVLKRLDKEEEKIEEKKEKKPSKYVKIANKIFSERAIKLLDQGKFRNLRRNLIQANLQFLPKSYISVIFFTTLLSVFAGFFIFLFFLFFNIGAKLPIITLVTENIMSRFVKVFWILFLVPIATFLIMYVYPSLEKKSVGSRIDQELPFATIHMSAISGSMIDPSKIFSIIILTKEYPHLEKEFVKLMNEINVFGYDIVTALRNNASSSASKKLSELFNGLATTITSGGNLPGFFNKRAQTLLFDYRLEREKYTKSAETFMDIYISVVIAAPMILMLLLMMMKISGLGISLSTSMITLIMILGVSVVNFIFIIFLHLKQPAS